MSQEKIDQLTKDGEGYATAIMCPKLKIPFVITAATVDDLMRVLVISCQIEPEMITKDKFRRITMRFPVEQS